MPEAEPWLDVQTDHPHPPKILEASIPRSSIHPSQFNWSYQFIPPQNTGCWDLVANEN
jgi:hypothetical protein